MAASSASLPLRERRPFLSSAAMLVPPASCKCQGYGAKYYQREEHGRDLQGDARSVEVLLVPTS